MRQQKTRIDDQATTDDVSRVVPFRRELQILNQAWMITQATCRAAVLGLPVAVVGEAGGVDPSTWGPSPDPIFGRNTMMSFSLKEDAHLWCLL